MRFNMKSGNFSHTNSSTLHKKSQHISWDYFSNENSSSFYIDGDIDKGISERNDGKRKFLWGLESRHFNSSFHKKVKENLSLVLDVYENIFTYDNELLELDPKFKWAPAMGTWIDFPGRREKHKLCSMVTSSKNWTPGQVFRINYANQHSDKIDIYGSLLKPIGKKEEALDDYMFSVAIENDICDSYFTEKILDCFSTYTIPIYRGTRRICDFFNPDGIIFIDGNKLPELSEEIYFSKMEALNENLEKVIHFNTIEDWMFENYKEIFTN